MQDFNQDGEKLAAKKKMKPLRAIATQKKRVHRFFKRLHARLARALFHAQPGEQDRQRLALSQRTQERASLLHLYGQQRFKKGKKEMASASKSSDGDVDAAVDEAASTGAALSFTDFLERMKDPAAGEGLEKYVLTKIHAQVFGASALDVERDEALSQRLSALSFVRPEHLEIPASHAGLEEGRGGGGGATSSSNNSSSSSLSSSSPAARALALAQRELSRVNAFKAPRDKLVCVLNACRVISDSLSAVASREAAERREKRERGRSVGEEGGGVGGASAATTGAPSPSPPPPPGPSSRGADDFLPLLIYVLIRAAPPRLASNLEYVQRFRGARRFHGEAAYFFTQLYAAASFVETVNTTSLHNVDPAEFVARMASAGVPDMQLLPPPRAVVEAALASGSGDEGGGGGGDGERGGATTETAAAAARPPPPPPRLPRAGEEASSAAEVVVRENPAFFLAPRERTTTATAMIPRDLPRHESPLVPPPPSSSSYLFYPTAEQLEKEGEKLVVAADEAGELAGGDRFLDAALAAEDLSIADVSELLRNYRATALRCEALARAADARAARAWRDEAGEEESAEGGREGGAVTAAATATSATAAVGDTFVPSPPWVPSSSAAAAGDEDEDDAAVDAASDAAAAEAAVAPEAELDLSALSLSAPPPPQSSSPAAPLLPLQPPQRPLPPPPPSASPQLDVAHLLTSSTSTTTSTTPRAAELVDAVNVSGSGNNASLI